MALAGCSRSFTEYSPMIRGSSCSPASCRIARHAAGELRAHDASESTHRRRAVRATAARMGGISWAGMLWAHSRRSDGHSEAISAAVDGGARAGALLPLEGAMASMLRRARRHARQMRGTSLRTSVLSSITSASCDSACSTAANESRCSGSAESVAAWMAATTRGRTPWERTMAARLRASASSRTTSCTLRRSTGSWSERSPLSA